MSMIYQDNSMIVYFEQRNGEDVDEDGKMTLVFCSKDHKNVANITIQPERFAYIARKILKYLGEEPCEKTDD